MKKNIFILLLIGTVFSAQAENRLRTAADSVSYALGMSIGHDLGRNLESVPGGPLNVDLLIEAMTKELKGNTEGFLLDRADLMQIIQTYMMRAEEEAAKKSEAENNLFLENNKKRKGVITTASGLQYEVLKPVKGKARQPQATDIVKVHYHGTLIDGTVFDSSVDRGEPVEFPLNQVIPGWTEGVQLMPVGSKFRFFIPPALGYGSRPAGQIPPNSILIFDVELLEIVPTPIEFEQYRSN